MPADRLLAEQRVGSGALARVVGAVGHEVGVGLAQADGQVGISDGDERYRRGAVEQGVGEAPLLVQEPGRSPPAPVERREHDPVGRPCLREHVGARGRVGGGGEAVDDERGGIIGHVTPRVLEPLDKRIAFGRLPVRQHDEVEAERVGAVGGWGQRKQRPVAEQRDRAPRDVQCQRPVAPQHRRVGRGEVGGRAGAVRRERRRAVGVRGERRENGVVRCYNAAREAVGRGAEAVGVEAEPLFGLQHAPHGLVDTGLGEPAVGDSGEDGGVRLGLRLRQEQQVDARFEGLDGRFAGRARGRDAAHVEPVGHHEAAKAEAEPELVGHDGAAQRRRTRRVGVERRHGEVAHHDRHRAAGDEAAEGRELNRVQPLGREGEKRKDVVRVGVGVAVAGKVLRRADKAAVLQPAQVRAGHAGHERGPVAVGARVDDGVEGVRVDVRHRSVILVDAHGARLVGHGAAHLVGERRVAGRAERHRGRKGGAVGEPHSRPVLHVLRHEQRQPAGPREREALELPRGLGLHTGLAPKKHHPADAQAVDERGEARPLVVRRALSGAVGVRDEKLRHALVQRQPVQRRAGPTAGGRKRIGWQRLLRRDRPAHTRREHARERNPDRSAKS